MLPDEVPDAGGIDPPVEDGAGATRQHHDVADPDHRLRCDDGSEQPGVDRLLPAEHAVPVARARRARSSARRGLPQESCGRTGSVPRRRARATPTFSAGSFATSTSSARSMSTIPWSAVTRSTAPIGKACRDLGREPVDAASARRATPATRHPACARCGRGRRSTRRPAPGLRGAAGQRARSAAYAS